MTHVFDPRSGFDLEIWAGWQRIEVWGPCCRVEGSSLVSVYAFDPARRVVLAVWPATAGSLAHVVTLLPAGISGEQASALCAALSRLSGALWDTYVRPASAVVEGGERWRREHERERFDEVAVGLRQPNLPDESGLMSVSYSPVGESAHRLGRVLHRLADPAITVAVSAEVQVEVDAVMRAELGDLSGRAVQAVALDRLDVSPLQVTAADEVLQAAPLGSGLLSAAIDPAAACVSAAHWLAAAAVVAADAAGGTPAGVFAEADDIQAVSVRVLTLVVELIEGSDVLPRRAVLDLLRAAVAAGDGEIADLPGVVAERARLEELVQCLPADRREEMLAAESVRTTLLDPRRPARDLLEHLLDGIASCYLLYAEYADADDLDVDGDGAFDGADTGDDVVPGNDVDVEDDANDADEVDAEAERREDIAEEFAELVRDQAAVTRTRLS